MTPEKKLEVLIVDDERAARQRLEDLLAREADVEVAGQATNGREAIEAIDRLAPDLVFLDVQMPGLTGLDVVREVGPEHMPALVFVTAYDQYALKAFDVAAIDYLLKPYDDERFEQALARARKKLATQMTNDLQRRLAALLGDSPAPPLPSHAKPQYLERIGVDMRGQMRIVPVDRIDFIQASGSYAELHVEDATFVIREQMQTLEERLDPHRFFRIHRSTIVQLDRVEALKYSAGGDYAVRLRNGRHLRVSRGRYEDLQRRLGLDAPSVP
ncbi:MAG: LytR/AlgR family response regulator transcription factor [Rhodothermales bacterium]